MTLYKILKTTTLILFLASCTPKIEDLSLYQKQFMPSSNYLPSKEQIAGKAPKIAVFPLEENGEVAEQSKIGKSVASDVENVLANNKLAKLVDRRATERLQKEIKLAELNKTGSYKGPQVADFAISGSISNASFSKKYNSGSTYYNPKSGTYTNIPPSFKYSAQVSGNLKIYELPSMNVAENIKFEGYSSRKENVQQQGGFNFAGLSIGGKQAEGIDRDDGLVRDAGQDAINSIQTELKNVLSARGYVLEKRIGDDFTIFKVTIGSDHGIKHGDEVKIFGKYDVTNPITQESEIETRQIAEGIVSDIINAKTSWIIVKDDKKSQQVRLGDTVKLIYERGAFADLMRDSRKYLH